MKRTYALYLRDILMAVERIQTYTQGLTLEALRADQKTLDATQHNLQIIGEAVGSLPPELKDRHPEVPWSNIRHFRNFVVHRYWAVDFDILWDVLQNKLEPLREQVSAILDEGSP